MSSEPEQSGGILDLVLFARRYFADGGLKLLGVLVLQAVLSAITGVGLLLILPLLGLLGFGAGDSGNPVWRALSDVLGKAGVSLTLETGLLLFVGVVGIRALLAWRRDTWQVEVEQWFQDALRNELYVTLSRTELFHLQRLRTAEFIQSSQSEIRRAQQAANALLQLISQALNLLAYFVVALLLSAAMTLVAMLCGGAAFLLMLPLVRRTHALSRQQIRVRSSMINNLIEHVQGLRTARSLGLTERFVEDYCGRSALAARVAIRLTRLSALSGLFFQLVAVVLLAVLVYVGITRLAIEPARFVVLLLIFIRTFPAIGEFQNQVQLFVSLVPSFRHYLDLLKEMRRHEEVVLGDLGGVTLKLEHTLELREVTFAYRVEDGPALEDVSLRVERGALTAVAGHSGSGKSTLVDIITGLLPSGGGNLYLDGRQLNEFERIGWRREAALVPQESYLLNDTIRANLTCVRPTATEDELWEVLDAVNCREFVQSRREGLDAEVGEGGGLLSGGERQRLSIARALLRRPQLLVLDEPTNNLDRESVEALLGVLGTLKHHTTLLAISHDERILSRADCVYRLAGGRLVERPGPAGA